MTAPAILAFALSGCVGMHGLNASATEEWTRSYPLAAGGELSIENGNGRIEIEPSDGATVDVRAEKIAKAATEAGARELLPRITISDDAKPDRVSITTARMSGVMIGAGFEVRYHVRAPKTAALNIRQSNGSITVNGWTGDVSAHGTNGAVIGKGLSGGVDASAVNGAVTIDMASVGAHRISLQTTNGGVTLALPDEAKADVDAAVTNGGISVNGVKLEVTEQSRRRLQGKMNGGGTAVELKTVNGGVRLRSRAMAEEGGKSSGSGG
jgi:DUF4097 and DUF4098 domain-containing protein YvlB